MRIVADLTTYAKEHPIQMLIACGVLGGGGGFVTELVVRDTPEPQEIHVTIEAPEWWEDEVDVIRRLAVEENTNEIQDSHIEKNRKDINEHDEDIRDIRR